MSGERAVEGERRAVPETIHEDEKTTQRGRMATISIGALLALLIAVTIVPPIAFSVILLQRNNLAQQEIATTLAEATAGSIMESVDRQLQGMRNTLRVLSTSASLEEDFADFHLRAQTALADTGAYIIVFDGEANQLLNTRVPYLTPLSRATDPEPIRTALDSGESVVSDGFFGQTARRWVFNVILPWDGPEERAIVMTQNVETLASALNRQNLRGGWNAVIVDRNGVVLASTYLSSDIGQPFFLRDALLAAGNGSRHSLSLDGADYETISKRSELSGWQAIVWAPGEIVRQPMLVTLRALMLGGLAMVAIGTIVAWLLGRQVSKPIRKLAADARRLGAGEDIAAEAFPVTEVATVSAALAQASADRKAAENEIRFLMREVAHRSKNQLTVVSSIAKQTARNTRSFTAFQDRFQERLQGLARSTDLLLAGGVAGVELSELLNAQVEPFRPSDDARFNATGPRFLLSHQAAQTLGMAFHELATNASKYGAFSNASGRLEVKWHREGDDLSIHWREYVPRLRRRPEARGFGTEVIERMLGGALDAQIARELRDDGLDCRFTMPSQKLRPAAER